MSKENDFFEVINQNNEVHLNLKEYSPLNLAYLGDAIFEVLVRSKLLTEENSSVNNLHKKAKNLVKAQAQADMYHKIILDLTDDEMSIMKRGRNAKSFSSAKNASISEYRHATGLEALFGYLFLKGDTNRIIEIFNKCIQK